MAQIKPSSIGDSVITELSPMIAMFVIKAAALLFLKPCYRHGFSYNVYFNMLCVTR